MSLRGLRLGLTCPRCLVDLEDKWDFDQHMELHLEADKNKEAVVHDSRQTGEQLLSLLRSTHAPQQSDNAKRQDHFLLSLIDLANSPQQFDAINSPELPISEKEPKTRLEAAKLRKEIKLKKSAVATTSIDPQKTDRSSDGKVDMEIARAMSEILESEQSSGGRNLKKAVLYRISKTAEPGKSSRSTFDGVGSHGPDEISDNVDEKKRTQASRRETEEITKKEAAEEIRRKSLEAKGRRDSEENKSAIEMINVVQKTTGAADKNDVCEEIRTEVSRGELKNMVASTSGAEKTTEAAEKTEVEEKEINVYDIFLAGLLQVHAGYLASLSTSSDESLSARRLEKCKELAMQLSYLVVGPAHEESSAVLLNIVKAGLDYAFKDAPHRLSFLACGVIYFASELSRAGFLDVLKNVEDRMKNINLNEDQSCWLPYFTFVDTLRKMSSEAEQAETECDVGNSKGWIPNHIVGEEGERVAFKYFCETSTDKKVTWVNKHRESGYPYDLLIRANDNSFEYVEVKTTRVSGRYWFRISLSELDFALEQGDSFIIALVDLLDWDHPRITTHRDLRKLLKSKKFRLAVHPY